MCDSSWHFSRVVNYVRHMRGEYAVVFVIVVRSCHNAKHERQANEIEIGSESNKNCYRDDNYSLFRVHDSLSPSLWYALDQRRMIESILADPKHMLSFHERNNVFVFFFLLSRRFHLIPRSIPFVVRSPNMCIFSTRALRGCRYRCRGRIAKYLIIDENPFVSRRLSWSA